MKDSQTSPKLRCILTIVSQQEHIIGTTTDYSSETILKIYLNLEGLRESDPLNNKFLICIFRRTVEKGHKILTVALGKICIAFPKGLCMGKKSSGAILTLGATIKFRTHSWVTFRSLDTDLEKACNNCWVNRITNGFVSVKSIASKYLGRRQKY